MRLFATIVVAFVSMRGVDAVPAPIGRLGRDVVPVSQSITLDLDPRKPDYTGSVDIVLDVKQPARSFPFHAEAIDLLELSLRRAGSSSQPIRLTATPSADGQVEAVAGSEIPQGRYTLHIDFHNNFDTAAKGLYRLRAAGEWYAFTQFEAIEAREAKAKK